MRYQDKMNELGLRMAFLKEDFKDGHISGELASEMHKIIKVEFKKMMKIVNHAGFPTNIGNTTDERLLNLEVGD